MLILLMTTIIIFAHLGKPNSSSFFEVFKLMLNQSDSKTVNEHFKQIMSAIMIMFLSVAFISLFYLFSVNIYLMKNNLTIWELFSWRKITYLANCNESVVSPFSKGWKKNLKYYWKPKKKGYMEWKGVKM